jgi:hypothetical protein
MSQTICLYRQQEHTEDGEFKYSSPHGGLLIHT